jgi:hypothetical protein
MNFINNYKIKDENGNYVIDYSKGGLDVRFNRIPKYENIVQHVEDKCRELMKIKLGLFIYDIDSERVMTYSFGKMLEEYKNELEEQFKSFDDGDFLIKQSVMFSIEEFIFEEEINILMNLRRKRDKIFK